MTAEELADAENGLIAMANKYPNSSKCLLDVADAYRNARRYLALRNAAKTKEGRVKVQAIFWHTASRKDIDAAADRLLEGGE